MKTAMKQERSKLDWEDRIRKSVKKQGAILQELYCSQGNGNYTLVCLIEETKEAKIISVGEDGYIHEHAFFPLPYESCYRHSVLNLLMKSFQAWKDILSFGEKRQ